MFFPTLCCRIEQRTDLSQGPTVRLVNVLSDFRKRMSGSVRRAFRSDGHARDIFGYRSFPCPEGTLRKGCLIDLGPPDLNAEVLIQ